jgi:hypothetical protein
MSGSFTRISLSPGTATARVGALADAVQARTRTYAPLVELFRAHLESRTPGRSRSAAEHVLELVELGQRWRRHALPPRRDRPGDASIEELARLVFRLAGLGLPAAEMARLLAWSDFAVAEDVREVAAAAGELAAWFEDAARVLLGVDVCAPVDALALVRAEVVGRALRRRAPVFAPPPRHASAVAIPSDPEAGFASHVVAAGMGRTATRR